MDRPVPLLSRRNPYLYLTVALLGAWLVGCVGGPSQPRSPIDGSPPVSPSPEVSIPMEGEEVAPFPDALYGLFLEPASLQAAISRLPIPAAQEVAQRVWLEDDQAAVVAFLGTAAMEGYRVRIRDIRARESQVQVVVEQRGPGVDESAPPSSYSYPVDIRTVDQDRLPPPPFTVEFRTPEGQLLVRQEHVRPGLPSLAAIRREEEAGDTLQVASTIRFTYQDGGWKGQVIVRVHEVGFRLFWAATEEGVQVYGDLPLWLAGAQANAPACVVTDRPPREIAEALPRQDAYAVLTLRGVRTEINGRDALRAAAIPPAEMPRRAWMACPWSVLRHPSPDRWLGTEIVDLYPVDLERREAGTVEVVETQVLFHDIYLRLRLHPLPQESVPLDLVVLDPPRGPAQEGATTYVGAYLYHGFDRDPTRYGYTIGLHSGENGAFHTWLLGPEVHEFDLYARLGPCTSTASVESLSLWNPPPGAECRTDTLVQAFYTHASFLQGLGFERPVTLRAAIHSPQGWRSEPFVLQLP